MGSLTILTFVLFTSLVLVISYFKTRKENLNSQDGYFLAGRSLTGPVIAGSLMLTNLSTEQLVGLNGQSYNESMAVMAWEAGAAVALIVMALVFLPKYLKSGITTIPDFLEKRYDSGIRKLIAILFILSYVLTYLPTVLYSGAVVLNKLFYIPETTGMGYVPSLWLTVFAIGIVGSVYAIFGGLKAVVISDTINGIGLLIGGLMIPVLGLMALGDGNFFSGVNTLTTYHPEKLNPIGASDSSVPFAVMFTGMLFNNLYYWCTNQSIVQRTFGAKNLAQGQKGVILAGFLKLLGPFFLILPGIIAFHMFPSLAAADMAYPTLVNAVLPKYLIGFFGAVLFGAILSSFNSALNSTVTLFSLNIYKPIFKPNATDKSVVSSGKKFGIVLAIISMCVAPTILYFDGGLYSFLQKMNGFYSAPLLGIIIVGFFSKKVPSIAAKTAIVSHVIIYGIYNIVDVEINFLHILGVMLPLEVLIMMLICKIKPRKILFEHEHSGDVEIEPWKHVKLAAAILFILMVLIYAFFTIIGNA